MSKLLDFSLYLVSHRLVRFLFSGGMAVLTNVGLLFLLVHVFGIYYLSSSIIAFTVAIFVSFTLQKFFTFNDRNRSKIRQQATFYFGFQIFNLGVNTLFMYIEVDLLHIQYLVAQMLIVIVMTIYNFFVYKHLVFTPDAIYNKQ